jgi:hypothetical protein
LGRACTICEHAQHAEIDAELLSAPKERRYRTVARQWGISRDALMRHHAAGHITEALVTLPARKVQATETVLDRVRSLVATTEDLLQGARDAGSVVQALACIRELRGLLELLGKATGELKPDGQVLVMNVQANPEFLAVQDRLLQALAPYPEARIAAARAIQNGQPG